MNKSYLLLAAILFMQTANAGTRCHVEGLLNTAYTGYLTLALEAPKPADKFETTIPVTKGHFSADVSIPSYGVYYALRDSDYRTTRYLVIDTGNIYLYQQAGSDYIFCKGSKTMNDFSALLAMKDAERDAASIYIRAKMKQPNDTAAIGIGERGINIAMKNRRAEQTNFINKHPNSFASAYELTNYSFEFELDTINKVFASLGPDAHSSIYGRRVLEKIGNVRLLGVGRPAPDIKAKDPAGKVIRLSDYRGKYVLLDFWASWCAPCRIQAPFIRRVHKEYGSKVQVLSVSVDTKKDDWLEAVKKDTMSWVNIRDDGDFNGKAAKAYKLEGVPSIYLISPEGIILTATLHDRGIYTAVKKEMEKK